MEITEISKDNSRYNRVLDLLRQFDIHSAEKIEVGEQYETSM